MKLHELSPAAGSTQELASARAAVIGTGNGKTAGRGHKGQKARSGGGVRVGFEGGQMPLASRMPEARLQQHLCKAAGRPSTSPPLETFEDGAVVNAADLLEKGIISKCQYGIKVLGNGNLTKKLTVQAAAFSASAKEKIEAAGGKAEVV